MTTDTTDIFSYLRNETKHGCLVWPHLNREPIRWQGWTDDKLKSLAYTVPHWGTFEFDYDNVTYYIQQTDAGWICPSLAMDENGEGWGHVSAAEGAPVVEAFLSQLDASYPIHGGEQ